MGSLIYVIIFVLPSVLIGVAVGVYLGRTMHANKDRALAQQEREATRKALLAMLASAEQLTSDVDRHNTEIQEVGRDVGGMQVRGEFEELQQALLGQIASVLASNQRMEEDLTYTRHRMEEQAQEIDRTRREARTDALSGVANRKALDEKLHYLLTVFKRESLPFALVLADIDHFKWINDTHGHPAGDRVVASVGAFLRQFVRPGDFVARYGGDEFAILFPKTDLLTAQDLAERVHLTLTQTNFDVGTNGERVACTFSVGVSSVRGGDSVDSIVSRADQALFRSKNAGRNQVNVYRDADEPSPDEAPPGTDALAASQDL